MEESKEQKMAESKEPKMWEETDPKNLIGYCSIVDSNFLPYMYNTNFINKSGKYEMNSNVVRSQPQMHEVRTHYISEVEKNVVKSNGNGSNEFIFGNQKNSWFRVPDSFCENIKGFKEISSKRTINIPRKIMIDNYEKGSLKDMVGNCAAIAGDSDFIKSDDTRYFIKSVSSSGFAVYSPNTKGLVDSEFIGISDVKWVKLPNYYCNNIPDFIRKVNETTSQEHNGK